VKEGALARGARGLELGVVGTSSVQPSTTSSVAHTASKPGLFRDPRLRNIGVTSEMDFGTLRASRLEPDTTAPRGPHVDAPTGAFAVER
jgi:hypothetical protein